MPLALKDFSRGGMPQRLLSDLLVVQMPAIPGRFGQVLAQIRVADPLEVGGAPV